MLMNSSIDLYLLPVVRILLVFFGLWFQILPLAGQNIISCGTKDDELPDDLIRDLQFATSARKANETLKLCRIAVEIDSETYRISGRDTSLIRRLVLENIAHCSEHLEQQVNIRLVVADIRIWKETSGDPFSGTRSVGSWISRLNVLKPNTDQYDKRMLLYMGYSSDFAGIAYMPGAYSVSPLKAADVILHELGHNFSSPHTHNCNWPGGPIDHCFNNEGSCNSALENSLRGTVMSYCQGRSMNFHPLSRQVIRSHAEQLFSDIVSSPAKVRLAPQSGLRPGDFASWPASYGAAEYQVEFHEVGGSEAIKKISVPYNGMVIKGLGVGKEYNVRINAVNEWGESGWTSPVKWFVAEPTVDSPPQILYPINDQESVITGKKVTLSYLPVRGASQYEVEITNVLDYEFDNVISRTVTSDTQLVFESAQHEAFKWRVRTVGNSGPGRWSDAGSFSIWPGASESRFRIPNKNPNVLPRTFPFRYAPFTQNPTITVTISEQRDMSDPLVNIIHDQPAEQFTGTIRDLPAGKKLYLQLEERNSNAWNYPKEWSARFIMEFTTTTETLPNSIRFSHDMGIPPEAHVSQLYYTPGRIWYISPFEGVRCVHTDDLSSRLYDVRQTNGAWGPTQPSFMAVSKDGHLKLLSQSTEGYRYSTALSNDLAGELKVTPIFGSLDITGFNPDLDLFWQPRRLYQLSGNSLREIGSLPDHLNVVDVQAVGDFLYIRAFDTSYGGNRILKATRNASQTIETLEPIQSAWALGNIHQMDRSRDGKLWVLSGNPLQLTSIDESGATTYPSPGGSVNSIIGFYTSPQGSAYITAYDDSFNLLVFRWDSGTWKQIGSKFPFHIFNGSLVVDEYENIWIGNVYGLTMMSNCEEDDTPVLGEFPEQISYMSSVKFRATGCSERYLWSWRDDSGTNGQSEGEELSLSLKNDTWFTLKCEGGCPGAERSFQVRVNPVMNIETLENSVACMGDTVSASFNVEGTFRDKQVLVASFIKEGHAETVTSPFELSEGGRGSFVVPKDLTPGEYQVVLHLASERQGAGSPGALLVAEQPTASLFTGKTQIMQGIETAEIRIEFTGKGPWRFTDWEGKLKETPTSPLVSLFTAQEVKTYELKIDDLSDQYCENGMVKNSVTVSGILVLATEPGTAAIEVFPNPVATTLTIRSRNGRIKGDFFLVAPDGKTVRSLVADAEETPMSLSGLTPGVYILWTEIGGRLFSWKIIK